MHALLLCANDEDRDYLGFVLRQSGLATRYLAAGQEVAVAVEEMLPTFFLLAVGSAATAVTLVTDIRRHSPRPVLVLLETVVEEEHCALLDAGADLLLLRPISPRILSRYIRSLLSRVGGGEPPVLSRVEVGDVLLNPATRQVQTATGTAVSLTPLEFRLLYVLMTHAGQVLPLEMIVERVWGYSGEGNRELVRGLIRRLRRKLADSPDRPRFIHTVAGFGYRFDAE